MPLVCTLLIGRPQMWERVQVGFGSTGKKRKGPCTKQCAWRKHGSSDTRLAEACPPKLRNTVKHRVEETRPKWPFWKHRAPKMRLVEAQCAHRKHCYPEIPLGSPPTSRASLVELLKWLHVHARTAGGGGGSGTKCTMAPQPQSLAILWIGALQKGPPFHGSRSSREMKIQNASCQMGGREVRRWQKLLLSAGKWVVAKLQGDNQHPSLPWNFITHGILDPSAFPDELQTELQGISAARSQCGHFSSKRFIRQC